MTLRKFHNALRILLNIDMDEFVAAGCRSEQWREFRDNPHAYFIEAADREADALWKIIEERNAA